MRNISSVTGDDEDAAKKGNGEAVAPDDDNMTADAADLIDPGGWKLLMLAPENVKVKMLCPAKIKKNVVEMDAGLAHLIDAHDATKPNQLMKMDRFMTEVRRVKNCHDRAVTDVNFLSTIFSLKPTELRVSNQVNVRVVGNTFKLFHFAII